MKNRLDDVPKEFHGFELYRWRRDIVWTRPKVDPTAAECVESCWANMQTAAAEQAKAQAIYDAMMPGQQGLQFALGEVNRLRAEQQHWKGLMAWHRARVQAPADIDRRLPREPGQDDAEEENRP